MIEHDVSRVSHATIPRARDVSRDVERVVLASAVTRHFGDRIIVHVNRTIVFR
jgi:formyltetrahydrofolate hydrolase